MTAHDIAKLIDHALLGRLLSGDLGYVEREIRAIVEAAHELKVEGCRICERVGADRFGATRTREILEEAMEREQDPSGALAYASSRVTAKISAKPARFAPTATSGGFFSWAAGSRSLAPR